MTLTKIEKEYAKHIPEFVKEMHKSIFDKQVMDKEFREKLINSYETCFIGSIRQKLGLSKKYYLFTQVKCGICERFADMFMNVEQTKIKDDYIDSLEKLKEHLKDVHKKEL